MGRQRIRQASRFVAGRGLCTLLLACGVALAGCVRLGYEGPCDGITCSGHGTCKLVDREPICRCDPGYHELGKLACARDLPADLLGGCRTSLPEDRAYDCTPAVGPGDRPDLHFWALGTNNTCGWARVTRQTGRIGGVPDDDDVGTCTLEVVGDRDRTAPRSDTVVIEVTNVRPQITLAATRPVAHNAGSSLVLSDSDVQCTDEGHGVYSLAGSGAPVQCHDRGTLSIDATSGALLYNPATGFAGRCGGAIRFDDQNGATGTTSAFFEVDVQPLVGFGVHAATVDESAAYHPMLLTLTAAAPTAVSVPYVVGGTASPADHTLASGTWTIPAGRTSALVQLRIVDDLSSEGTETVQITLQQPTGAMPSSRMTHTLSITDNELPALAGVATIHAGHHSVCVQRNGGEVLCWGDNSHGQLAAGNTTSTRTPVPAVNLGKQLTGLSLGEYHGCALFAGAARCWGDNTHGKLGDGTTASSYTPVTVTGLTSGVTSIGAGANHSCAVAKGAAFCWGHNNRGQLGDGTTTSSKVPVAVKGLASGVAQIAVGHHHSCAILTDGSARCWGLNTRSQLGDNNDDNATTPVQPVGLDGTAVKVVELSLGYDHSCARLSTGGLRCWGANTQGQLGVGGTGKKKVPTDVVGLASGVKQVSVEGQQWGGGATCALTTAGALRCWGTNTSGQLGDDSTISRTSPVGVFGLNAGVVDIARTIFTSCAVLSGGGVTCWGTNQFGGLGNNKLPLRFNHPVLLQGLGAGSTTRAVAGGNMLLVQRVSGAVQAAGLNTWGQLGVGDRNHRLALTQVTGLTTGVKDLVAGTEHACARVGSGLRCWGSTREHAVGAGSSPAQTSPIDVLGLTTGVAHIAAGDFHSCAAPASGGVVCWGWNYLGGVGNGTLKKGAVKVPTAVQGIGAVEQVDGLFAGYAHTCAILAKGALKCWGSNSHGQLGDGTTTSASSAKLIAALSSGVVEGGGGTHHTCVRMSSGKVQCHGENTYGQLGDGTFKNRKLPVEVLGLSDAVDLAVYDDGACALTKVGAVWCWGANERGTVGDGTFGHRNKPTRVVGMEAGVASITANWRTVCAVMADKSVRCWGSNEDGLFGDGLMDHHPRPVTITAAP